MRISIRVKRAISIFLCFVMLFTTVDLSALRTLAAEGEPEIELENSAEESSEDEADAAEDEESDEDDEDAESEEDSENSDSSEDSDDSIKDDDDDSDDAVSDDNADEDDKDDADDNDQQDDADEETVSENEADKDDEDTVSENAADTDEEDTVSENAADTDEEDSDKFVFSLSRDDAAIWLPYGEYDSFEENIGTLQLEYTIDSDETEDEEDSETSDAADEQDDEQEIKISWESEDESVATVDGDGLVSAVSEGETLITATVVLDEQEYSASCSVTVEQGVIDVVRTTDDGETVVASFADLDSFFAFWDDADNDLKDGATVRIFSDMEIGYAGTSVMDIDEELSFDVRGDLKLAGDAALIVNGTLEVTGDTVLETGACLLDNGRLVIDTVNIKVIEKETEEDTPEYAYIARYYGDDENAGAEFAIKGLIKAEENAGLKIGLLDERAASSEAALKTIDGVYRLYDTEISEIAECVSVWLEEGDDAGYSGLAYNGDESAVYTAPVPLNEENQPIENQGDLSHNIELYAVSKNADGTYPDYKTAPGVSVGEYDTWAEAIAAINSKKDKTLRYRMVLNGDIGSAEQPISITFPSSSYYAGLYVEGENDPTINDPTIYYTNKITLNASAAFYNVDLAPVKAVKAGSVTSYQGAVLDISPGGYELIMDGVGLHTVNGVNCGIGSISGNGKNTLTIINVVDYGKSSLDIRTGDVKAATLTLEGQLNIDKGSLSVTDMVMKSESVLKSMGKAVSSTGTLNMQGNAQVISYSGAVNLKNVDLYKGADATSGNTIKFGRTSKNETTLKITGKVNTDADHKLGLMDDSMGLGYGAQELELNSGSYQVKPVASDLIASIGTNGTDFFSYNVDTDVYALVKYAGGVYYAKKADFGSYMVTMTGGGVSSAYLDWNEAIKEINSINDPAAEYVITVNGTGAYLKDTVLTDTAEYGKLVLPNAKKCALLKVNSGRDEKRLYFTDSTLKLNTNVAFDGIKLCSRSSTLSFSLGSSSLMLKDIEFDNNMDITSISGAASNGTSVLAVDGCNIRVTGNISKVGSVKLLNAVELRSDGSIDIGNVYVYGENNSTLVGTTKVSFKEYKDKNGKTHRDLSAITPAITINGEVAGIPNGVVTPKLQIKLNVAEKNGSVYTYTDLGTYIKNYIAGDYKNNCITFANTTGINFAKATKAAAEDVIFVTDYDIDHTGKEGLPAGGMTVKKAGYLAYTGNSSVSYELVCDAGSYPCLTFEDAVTEINNINNKNGEYTVKITGDVDSRDVNPDAPEKFTMPKAGTYSLLVIEGQGDTPVTLYYGVKGSNDTITAVNGIALTGNTVIKNVNFRDAEAYKIKREEDEKENRQNGDEDADNDYPNRAALSLSLGGKSLTIENSSFEGRALVIDGGSNGAKNAVLTLNGWAVAGKKISSLKNDYANAYVFEGEIRNIKDLKLPVGKKLLVRKYVAATSGTKKDAGLKVTSLTLNGNAIRSEGSITLTDVSTGAEASKSVIMADRAFTVSGKVFAGQYGNLALIGRSKSGSSVSPYLNITGTVTAESKAVAVGLLGYSVETTEMLKPGDALPILSASKCSAGQFAFITSTDWSNAPKVEDKVATSIVITGYERDLVEEHRGYFLAKEGNYIKAYKGTSACVELVRTDDVTTPVEENVDNVLGYYKTVDEALKVITTKKDKNASYVILLLKDMGTEDQPLTVSLPDAKLAKALAIQGINSNKVYLSKLSIVNDLSLVNIQVMVAGNVTMTKGKTLTLNNSNNNGAILKAQGSVALENIHNMADGELIFTRTEKNDNSQLKINGYVTNADGKQLRVYMENLWKNGHAQYSVDGYTVRAAADIKDTKLLFTAPYATQNDLNINIEGDNALSENVTDDGATVVKANNAFYYVRSDLRKGFAGLSIGDGAVAYYLDLNQALAQIKVYNDKTKDYTVQVGYLVGENSVIEDVNVIDKIDHSPIVMPTANTVRSLTIKTFSDNADKRTEINFSGDITAYVGANGKLELASLMLRPVKAANVKKAAVVSDTARIMVYRNTTDKTGEVTLVLSKTLLGNTAQGSFVNTIAGTKAVTNVEINGCDVTLKNGFTNINRLYIDDRKVTTGGSNTLTELQMSAGSEFISAGTTVLDMLLVDSGSPVLGIKSADKFKINKTVANQSDDGKVRVKLLAAKSTYMSVSYIDDNDPAYLDHNLVYAPLADASLFMAAPYAGDGAKVAYKNGSYVCVGKKDKMHAFVSSDDGMLSAYAPDYYGAVAAIDTWKTKTAYTIKIRDDDATKQTKALTLPKAANCSSLLIRPESDGNGNVKFKFTGTLKPVSDTKFERVMLVCCNTSGVPQNEAAIDLSYASLDLWNSCIKAGDCEAGKIFVSSIRGTKGVLSLGCESVDTEVFVFADINIGTLNITAGNVEICSTATVPKAIAIKNVNGNGNTSYLSIDAPISTAPLLKISGNVEGMAGIKIAPLVKASNGIYGYLTAAELNGWRTTAADTAKVLNTKRLAEMPNVDTAILTVQSWDDVSGLVDYSGGNVIKMGSYIYITE